MFVNVKILDKERQRVDIKKKFFTKATKLFVDEKFIYWNIKGDENSLSGPSEDKRT